MKLPVVFARAMCSKKTVEVVTAGGFLTVGVVGAVDTDSFYIESPDVGGKLIYFERLIGFTV